MRVPFLGGIDLETHEGEALDLGPQEVDSGVPKQSIWGSKSSILGVHSEGPF